MKPLQQMEAQNPYAAALMLTLKDAYLPWEDAAAFTATHSSWVGLADLAFLSSDAQEIIETVLSDSDEIKPLIFTSYGTVKTQAQNNIKKFFALKWGCKHRAKKAIIEISKCLK